MDRFRWCTDDIHSLNSSSSRGAAESLVLQQSGVRVYNGPGRTSFDNGTLKLTTHRLIWSDHAGGSKIHLPLAAVASTQLQTSSGLTGSGTPKIVVRLLSPSALETAFKSLSDPPVWAGDWIVDKAEKRVAISSGIDFAKCWLVSNLPTTVSGRTRGTGGILAIERAMAVKASSADRSISEAFEDLSRLISRASEMVALSRSLAEKHRSKKEAGTEVGEDETAELRRAMLSMGLSDDTSGAEISPAAGSAVEASSFHGQLAVQICKVLHPILTARTHGDRAHEFSGCIDLASAYCRINRARGVELISPEDLLYAARMMKHLKLPLRLKRFDSGVMVIELASESDESTTQSTLQCVESHQCLSAGALARLAGIAPILARERLLQAEERGLLCRDDSDGGLVFFPNLFETRAA
ncbi:hypothetical protein AAHC03_022586 [Spirometra sp. Aus1]